MPAQPEGDPAPSDGALPASAVARAADRTLSLYVHVPFCAVRCGYCDFNTYTMEQLGDGVSRDDYHRDAAAEVRFARSVLDAAGAPPRALHSVFFGGGTPTLLPARELANMLGQARQSFGLAPDAEVTVEANPDSVTAETFDVLAEAGVTRVSFGMQSAVPHVLRVLERTHTPANVPRAVGWAKERGLGTSVDLIYGTPGESVADWRTSLEAALEMDSDHVSAYSLIIEDGTKLAAQMRRGEVPRVDPDDQAEKYTLADAMLREAGFEWYEVSNWSRDAHGRSALENRSAHNLAYWRNQDWWGIGPGAHSHSDGVRWWNLKHPLPYTNKVRQGVSPAAGRETLDAQTRYVEDVMLGIRIRDGLETAQLQPEGRKAVAGLIADGWLDGAAAVRGTAVLTDAGRLMADAVTRRLLDW
ncbi:MULTISPECIES: radical SAM family heme chaperone HemW [Kocuria]|uniref:Heme chaperone HemW n=1 Tax=Kocuria varians TaxID=1272 RepID=A0A7D7Q4A5_KOCVA|nr:MULTISPECIES: radical SAM family heme chaperone HemW [Kocuria]MDN5631980.1 radical SAM family heme chaperone HemW [Kocuria sp.]QMS57098.1 Oxygen-independent coproporphyrinogen-III oxidase-like protein [Kocuria varians]RUP83469.1 coproporphyrinogen III oxidase [Kocuria sp. HSID17590]RUQ12036.1 coproporphyrinogen III oxidase [Kocuria sp. HSID17582]